MYAAEREALLRARAEGVAYLVGRSALRAAPSSRWFKVRCAAVCVCVCGWGGGCWASVQPLGGSPLLCRSTLTETAPIPRLQRFLVESLYGTLAGACRPTTASYNVPPEGLLTLGVDYQL